MAKNATLFCGFSIIPWKSGISDGSLVQLYKNFSEKRGQGGLAPDRPAVSLVCSLNSSTASRLSTGPRA